MNNFCIQHLHSFLLILFQDQVDEIYSMPSRVRNWYPEFVTTQLF